VIRDGDTILARYVNRNSVATCPWTHRAADCVDLNGLGSSSTIFFSILGHRAAAVFPVQTKRTRNKRWLIPGVGICVGCHIVTLKRSCAVPRSMLLSRLARAHPGNFPVQSMRTPACGCSGPASQSNSRPRPVWSQAILGAYIHNNPGGVALGHDRSVGRNQESLDNRLGVQRTPTDLPSPPSNLRIGLDVGKINVNGLGRRSASSTAYQGSQSATA
jgi:hypothetical protein